MHITGWRKSDQCAAIRCLFVAFGMILRPAGARATIAIDFPECSIRDYMVELQVTSLHAAQERRALTSYRPEPPGVAIGSSETVSSSAIICSVDGTDTKQIQLDLQQTRWRPRTYVPLRLLRNQTLGDEVGLGRHFGSRQRLSVTERVAAGPRSSSRSFRTCAPFCVFAVCPKLLFSSHASSPFYSLSFSEPRRRRRRSSS